MDQTIIDTLVSSVQIILNPNASQSERAVAHRVCEDFKETSPHCITCGLMLAEKKYPHIVRHFGLQLLEHVVRYRWIKLSAEEKTLLKSSSLNLIKRGTSGILDEQPHIKDAVSRIVVEIFKHEWPNNWPTVMTDFYTLCIMGPTQTELVLKVFLRLVEDIIIFQNMHHVRRREIVTALNQNLEDVMDLFIRLLEKNTKQAEAAKASGSDVEMQEYMKVSEQTLKTLNGYLDWVSMNHLIMRDSLLLQMLCLLLSHPVLQLPATDCLLTIVNRKGKLQDRKPLMILFHEVALSTILNAVVTAEKGSLDEHFYKVLQKCCQILVELGKQLCTLWGAEITPDVEEPPNFAKYLEALLACTMHPSQMLRSYTLTLWAQFLRHEKISQSQIFRNILPRLVESAAVILTKVGYPSQSNSPSCDYARLDFDSDEEFTLFFAKYRAECLEIIRCATVLLQSLTFSYATHWLKIAVNKPVQNGEDCNSPCYIEWDALSMYLESVMSRLNLDKLSQAEVDTGVSLLKAVLSHKTQEPLVLSCSLSCLSAMFVFLRYTPDALLPVLQKIFATVMFEVPGQTKSTRSKSVRNVRQHACSVLVKVCKQYQDMVFPVFDDIYSHVKTISSNPDQLSQMERCILTEAMIIVSNKFNDYQKQAAFIGEVLKPVQEMWTSEEFTNAFWPPDKFMSFVGLDQAPVEPSTADTCGINRSRISFCVHTILGVIKRCKWPEDEQVARSGGFVWIEADSGECILKNPATEHISGLLQNLLTLLKSLNLLFHPDYQKLVHADYAKAYDLTEAEIQTLLGILAPQKDNTAQADDKNPLQRMQNFLMLTYENGLHILGNAAQYLGGEFYTIPNLSQSLVQTVLFGLDVLPEYRMRPVIRVFLKPLVQNCRGEYYSTVILPVLAQVFPHMYTRLCRKWELINQRLQTRLDTDDQETQEVIEEQLTRQLTRDYLEFLCAVCLTKSLSAEDKNLMEDEDDSPAPVTHRDLGVLGKLCLQNDAVLEPLVITVFMGLNWMDTPTCNKCILLAYPLLRQLVAEKKMVSVAAFHFYRCILMSLQYEGQYEGTLSLLLSLGLQTYELLCPLFPELHTLMLEIPNCEEEALKAFEDKIFSCKPNMPDKKKKEAYKRLVSEAIGKHIGERFKREIQYQSLPILFRKQRCKTQALDEVEHKDVGLCDLFKPDSNGSS